MKKAILLLIPASVLLLSGCTNGSSQQGDSKPSKASRSKVAKKQSVRKPKAKNVDYDKPSENFSYPKHLSAKQDRILVSTKLQRVFIIHKNQIIYTMYCSTGSHNRTPKGNFRIQKERGNFFYSDQEHEGAKYYVSFKDHGTYLFHSTPVTRNGKVMKGVAKQLGKRPSSHGCVHLTFPDAKYLSVHAPVGMKVTIH